MDSIDSNTSYELKKTFTVTPDKIFNAFIDESILKKIWGVSDIVIDARPEGKAHAKLMFDNENRDLTITYKEVVPGEKLRWIVSFDRSPEKEIRVTLMFKKIPGETEFTLRQKNFDNTQERDNNKQAWERALETLEENLQ